MEILHHVESRKDLMEVTRDLEAAAAEQHFSVLMVHDLKAKRKEKGVGLSRDCLVYELCEAT